MKIGRFEMNLNRKIKFVAEVMEELHEGLNEKLKELPEEWDGLELREWIKDYYENNFAYLRMSLARKRAYCNECRVRDLL